MTAKPTSDPASLDLLSLSVEHAPYPMAIVEGATHLLRYVNPAFCRLTGKPKDELVGIPFCEVMPEKSECQALLDRVYRTGNPESHKEREHPAALPVLWSYAMWPVIADERTLGVVIQVTETTPLYEKTLAMNEALLLGSLRQHEIAAAVNLSNTELRMEVGERKQRERDAQMLTHEAAHRIMNNLQIVSSLIMLEAKRAPAPCLDGYGAMQVRIAAIAELYNLISQSSDGRSVPVDAYLGKIAKTMTASLLGETSGIEIEVRAAALTIDSDRAVPFGLLVNELATNAVKHAFAGRAGRVVLSVEEIDDQVELTVADNGTGMKEKDARKLPEKRGADYVAIFVRQLGGTIAVTGAQGSGTTVKVRFPLLAVASGGLRA